MDYRAIQDRHELNVYSKRDRVLVRGQGSTVWDSEGRRYIDCAAGHGVASLGHCNEAVADAVAAQARKLITCPGIFYNDAKAELLARLASIAPTGLSRAFLCNSGAEAIEAAIKFARITTGRTDFVCATRAFHGRTCGALSATFNPDYREPFEPLVPGFGFVPFNNIEKLTDAVTDGTAAVLLEIVQGEGGVHRASGEFLHAARQVCDQSGSLLIVDEIQSGFCRTGRMFACAHDDVRPDMLCVAKAIAGGLPLGAVLCGDAINVPVGKHGSTFGGNPLCCAAGVAAIDFMVDQKLDEQAAAKGAHLLAALGSLDIPIIREVRGLGLMIGIELRQRSKPYLVALLERGIIALPAGATVIRLLPPLTISYEELDLVTSALEEVLARSSDRSCATGS